MTHSPGRGMAAVGLLAALVAAPSAAQQAVSLPARDVALREQPAAVFTVGTIEGQDWEMFSGVRTVAFDRADNLHVLDGQNSRVVVFDAQGRFVRQFGRKGGGPGEFEAPISMTVLANGEVVINDIGNRAYIIYSGTGEYLRNVPYPAETGMPAFGILQPHPLGVLSRMNPRPTPRAPGHESAAAPRNVATVFVQPLREDAAPIPMYEVALPPPQQMEAGAGRFVSMRMDPVFGAPVSVGALPDGSIAVHHESAYNVRLFDRSGRPVRTITRAIEPRRVTKQDQEAWQARRDADQASGGGGGNTIMMTQTVGGGGGGGTSISVGGGGGGRVGGGSGGTSTMQFTLDNVPFAEFMSVVTGLRTDALGRIWVQRRNADATAAGPIDLISATGRYIGTLPAQALPDAVSASDLAAFIVRDDLGVERVVVRRLPAAWRPQA